MQTYEQRVLALLSADEAYTTEEVGQGIYNVMRDGEYLATVTITRTPGY